MLSTCYVLRKELVAVSCNFLSEQKYLQNLNDNKTGVYFSAYYAWYSIQFDIVR